MEIYHFSSKGEILEYAFFNIVIGPAIFILILFILHKMKVEKAYRQWMDHKDIWRWGIAVLSAYPVLEMAITVWFVDNGMHRSESWMLSCFMLAGILIVFHYIGQEGQQEKEIDKRTPAYKA